MECQCASVLLSALNYPNISHVAVIDAPPPVVWRALTDPPMVIQWMAEPEVGLQIITEWKAGGQIIIKGFHHGRFENKGIVQDFEPNKLLRYTHLSSVSRLPDKPENYTTMEFRLEPVDDITRLTLTIINFPTESIFRHLEFYWKGTIVLLKDFVERQGGVNS